MAKLTVTARGQVTLRKEVLRHLGVKPGEKIELDLLPGRRASLGAVNGTRTWKDMVGYFDGKTNGRKLTIEEINQAIEEEGARAGMGECES